MMKIRYTYIKHIVNDVFISCNLNCYPVDLFLVFKHFKNCRVVSYSTHMKKFNLNEREAISHFGSDEGCTIYNPTKDKYIIFYNDLDSSLKVPERVRWTLAHELGHVLLKHHKISDKTKIFRNYLTDDEYSWMEAEANRFASLLLAHPIILKKLNVKSNIDIKKYCNISLEASTYRFNNYLNWEKNKFTDKSDLIILKQFEKFFNRKTCTKCKCSSYIEDVKFCPICGKTTFNKEKSNMIYSGIDLNELHKAKICPTCDNEFTNIDGEFCQICGTNIINKCTNNFCENLLSGEDRYCRICGSKSTFYKNKLLCSWEFVNPKENFCETSAVDDELPF